MSGTASVSTALAISFCLVSLMIVTSRSEKRAVDWVFATFCGSTALAILRPFAQDPMNWTAWLFVLGSCATCNAYWLISRTLFRGESGIDRQSLVIAGVVAALILIYGLLKLSLAPPNLRDGAGALLSLASSTLLVMALAEPLRGWRANWSMTEKRFRLIHVAVFGSCVLATVVLGALARGDEAWRSAYSIAAAISASAILVHTHLALRWRDGNPVDTRLHEALPTRAPEPSAPTAEDLRIAEAVRRAVGEEALYRNPDLRVGDLAAHIDEPEHRVTRAITRALGERNFNQLVNRYRIDEACRQLHRFPHRQILQIALECGFASLGTFNRSFRSMKGCTPSSWRAGHGEPSPGPRDAMEAAEARSLHQAPRV